MNNTENCSSENAHQKGFSLIETVIALVVTMIIALGVAAVFVQATKANSGNGERTQALKIAQQRLEEIRSARFTPNVTDSVLTGGTRTPVTVNGIDQRAYLVEIEVDDDPKTSGIQTNTSTTLKEITIQVTPATSARGSWIRAYPVRIKTQRARTE